MNVHLVEKINPDLTAVNAARVSYANSSLEIGEREERLLSFLKKHNHAAPFWHYEVVKHIRTTPTTMYYYFRHPWIASVRAKDIDASLKGFYVKTSVWGWEKILEKGDMLTSSVVDEINDGANVVEIEDDYRYASKLSSVTLYIENVPVPIREQFLKHRMELGVFMWDEYSLARSELSRRFTPKGVSFHPVDVFYAQSKDNKQASNQKVAIEDPKLYEKYRQLEQASLDFYNYAIAAGVAKQQARFGLLQSMNTSWYWTGNVDAYARIVALRNRNYTGAAQDEAQQLSSIIEDEVSSLYPKTWAVCMDKWKEAYS